MAGGIDWFRWHHGTVTDQKFPLIAKRSGASVAEVIAVWACVLEAASQNEGERGMLSAEPDFEAMDCALGLSEGRAEAVYRAMVDRKLLDQHRQISAWPRRQPKREREDDNSTDRVRAHRERKRHETPSNASDGTETPRGEESRGDISTSLRSVEDAPKRGTRKCPQEFSVTSELLTWALEKFPRVDTSVETDSFRDHTFDRAIHDWPGAWRNWIRRADKFAAPKARASPQSFRQQDADDAAKRVAAFTGGLVSAKPTRTMEVIDVTPRSVGGPDLLEDVPDLRRGLEPHVGRA